MKNKFELVGGPLDGEERLINEGHAYHCLSNIVGNSRVVAEGAEVKLPVREFLIYEMERRLHRGKVQFVYVFKGSQRRVATEFLS